MTQFLTDNKEIIAFVFSLLGMLLTFFFRGLLEWRHKICFDYDSKRDVAINILQDRFVQQSVRHHEEVAREQKNGMTEIQEIYKRPEQVKLIQSWAINLDVINRVKRYFRFLNLCSRWALYTVWISILLTPCPLINIWSPISSKVIQIAWIVLLIISLVALILFVSFMLIFDGRFFNLVNSIIEPETE